MDIILDNLDPALASQKLVELSVQYASLVSKVASAEVAYNQKLRKYLEDNPELPANKAMIHAKGGELWGVLRKLQADEKGLLETIRALKRFTRIKEDEYRNSSNL
jgi:hypothetical protein